MPDPETANALVFFVIQKEIIKDYFEWCNGFGFEKDDKDTFFKNVKHFVPDADTEITLRDEPCIYWVEYQREGIF